MTLLKFIAFSFLLTSNISFAQDVVGASKQILGNYLVGTLKNNTPDFIKYLDMEYTYSADNPDNFSLSSLSAITETDTDLFFNQTSIMRHDDNTTVNLGFGYRSLLNADKMIFGINAFYDREINVTHQRYGVGIELLTSIFDLRSNYYEAFTDTKLVENNETEKALDGWDMRFDYHMPIAIVGNNSVTAFVAYYEWAESSGDFEVDGYKVGFTSKLYKNLYVETGIDDDGTSDKDFYFLVSYALKIGDDKLISQNDHGAYEFASVKHRMYEKVLRENRIIKVVKGAVKVKRGN